MAPSRSTTITGCAPCCPFQGPKYHINIDKNEWPSAEELGFPNYERLVDVPGDVDFVIVSVPAQVVPYVIKDCIAKGVAGVHLYTAGYGETGMEDGIQRERELLRLAHDGGLDIVGPNCLGVFNPKVGLGVNLGGYHGDAGNFAFHLPERFPVGRICQGMSGQRDQSEQAGQHGQRHHSGQHGLP